MKFNLVPSRQAVQMTIGGAIVSAELLVNTAQAAAIDVAATVTDIGAQLVPIGLIGAAIMGVYLAIKAYHWVRRAMA